MRLDQYYSSYLIRKYDYSTFSHTVIDTIFDFFDDFSAGETPDPIPTSEVKACSADDSATFGGVKVGRCRETLKSPIPENIEGWGSLLLWNYNTDLLFIPISRTKFGLNRG